MKMNIRALRYSGRMPTHPLLQQLAENLASLRKARGLSRDALAAKAQVDPQMVKRIEKARANPALVVLSRLTSALAISLSLVLAGDLTAGAAIDAVAEIEAFESDAVAETITSLRKSRGISRRALAAQAGLRTLTLSRYETAAHDARLLATEPIAKALGLDTAELIRTIELRQQQASQTRAGWHTLAEGVRRRLVARADESRLWEWRIAPAIAYEGERAVDVAEEIVTAIRGEVRLQTGDSVKRLRRGGTATVPEGPRRLANSGTSTARVLWFEVTK